MPMTAAGLQALLETNLTAESGAPTDASKQTAFAKAVAESVIAYIQANGLVTVTAVVTSGAGAGGAVTGTGTIS